MAKQQNPLPLLLLLGSLLLLTSSCKDDAFLENMSIENSADAHISPQPTMLDQNLQVREVISGLVTPTSMAFLGPNNFLVLEKNTGIVKHIVDGAVQGIALDLAVNYASERGLLGIAMHPNFPATPKVYLFWTESTSGADTNVLSATSLLGNRVDCFTWDGSFLTFQSNLIRIRALQQDATNPTGERGNHNGGVLRFGPDGKLYIFVGDLGRRGQLQNLVNGPAGDGSPDDQFGGPQPDAAHLTGVILRLNDDGSTPSDNPFFAAGSAIGGDVGASIQKIFSYGHRNSFGMAFDPKFGNLWLQENGDDSFSELNRVEPGMNGGWIQIMGPVSRISQYKQIETSPQYFGLQQFRWLPTNIANSPAEALSRLYMLPGAKYKDPEFAWKYEVSPGGIGFVDGRALGPQYDGDLVMGAARDFLKGGHLFRLEITGNGRKVGVDGARLEDRVADNHDKWDITESESLLFGKNFGVGTDVKTGPNGNLFVVSLSHGAVYEIYRSKPTGAVKKQKLK